MAFQNHQEAVCGALVQLQGRGDLRQSKRHFAFCEQIQNCERAV
jgi:hypothetical protein